MDRPAPFLVLLLLCSVFPTGVLPCAAQTWDKHVIVENTRTAANSVVANDFDGDGFVDVISSYRRNVVLLRGPRWKPTLIHGFSERDSKQRPQAACIHSCLMDVDGDGDQDFCGSNNTVFWLECPEDPFSGDPWVYRTIDDEILGTHCLITGDVNRDGKQDLIANSFRTQEATRFPNSIVWLEVPFKPDTASSWTRHVFADRDAPGGSHYMGFGDINGDGRPDISCAAKGGDGFPGGQWFAWWEQPKQPTMVWKKHLLADQQAGASNIHPLDINRDGHVDFVATRGHASGLLWFRGPEWSIVEIDTEIEGPHCLVTQDLDADGDVDIATCGRNNDGIAAWYENNGTANFTKHVIGKEQGCYDLRAVDMDRDSDLDLLVAGHGSRNIVWFENPTIK